MNDIDDLNYFKFHLFNEADEAPPNIESEEENNEGNSEENTSNESQEDSKEEETPPEEETPKENNNDNNDNKDDIDNEELKDESQEEIKEIIPKSLPSQADDEEKDKNGVRRKMLYIEFINWCKEFSNKNTFGSIFDKDAFHVSYPFVPHEMRYFYRLANPLLCILSGDLTFFALSELRKVNQDNYERDKKLIFAATKTDLRIFSTVDKKVYLGIEDNGKIKLTRVLGNSFDTYLQTMIKKGDILNKPLEDENVDKQKSQDNGGE